MGDLNWSTVCVREAHRWLSGPMVQGARNFEDPGLCSFAFQQFKNCTGSCVVLPDNIARSTWSFVFLRYLGSLRPGLGPFSRTYLREMAYVLEEHVAQAWFLRAPLFASLQKPGCCSQLQRRGPVCGWLGLVLSSSPTLSSEPRSAQG